MRQRVVEAFVVLLAAALWAGGAGAANVTALQSIEPSTIALGGSARLTITAVGGETPAITPPMVPGLEFLAVGQSQQIEIINGVASSRTTVTYEVIPRQAGVFTIPSALPGGEPVVLTVNRGNGTQPPPGSGAGQGGQAAQPQTAPQLPAGTLRQGASGAAFVRLRLAKHELYVGEMIPVDIEVGARDGMVASLNGPPALNGDAFTLSKLPENPARTEEIIDGKPYIVFTWHTALVAIKPGALSLTVDMPLTVRVQSAARPGAGSFSGSGFEDLFNDPAFQNFFGRSMQREVTVSSAPETFNVLALPAQGRPASFSGAVGKFTVSSDLSQDKVSQGDPVTLKLHVSGEGDFGRVSSPMLHDGDGWKAYTPTSTFKPSDAIGYHGEKTFEQPLIATQSGERKVPEVDFSWFDPDTRRYEHSHTQPLIVAVAPASGGGALASTPPPAEPSAGPAWRPDHPETASARAASLRPRYFQPLFGAIPPLLLLAFSAAWLWVRHAERAPKIAKGTAPAPPSAEWLNGRLERHASAGDTESFFDVARAALRRALALKWGVDPAAVTADEVAARLGADSDISRLFSLADEAAYSRLKFSAADFERWKRIALGTLETWGSP